MVSSPFCPKSEKSSENIVGRLQGDIVYEFSLYLHHQETSFLQGSGKHLPLALLRITCFRRSLHESMSNTALLFLLLLKQRRQFRRIRRPFHGNMQKLSMAFDVNPQCPYLHQLRDYRQNAFSSSNALSTSSSEDDSQSDFRITLFAASTRVFHWYRLILIGQHLIVDLLNKIAKRQLHFPVNSQTFLTRRPQIDLFRFLPYT